jgi:hypothetical protein
MKRQSQQPERQKTLPMLTRKICLPKERKSNRGNSALMKVVGVGVEVKAMLKTVS